MTVLGTLVADVVPAQLIHQTGLIIEKMVTVITSGLPLSGRKAREGRH
jgi:hypothetical protein